MVNFPASPENMRFKAGDGSSGPSRGQTKESLGAWPENARASSGESWFHCLVKGHDNASLAALSGGSEEVTSVTRSPGQYELQPPPAPNAAPDESASVLFW